MSEDNIHSHPPTKNLNIWYIYHYAVPPEITQGGRPQYIGKELAKHGHRVTIFAASDHHYAGKPCGHIPFEQKTYPDGYTFQTIPTPSYKGNAIGRFRNSMAFSRGMKEMLVKKLHQNDAPDLIIVSSPHPWAWPSLAKEAHGKIKMIFEVRDIWPESLVELANVSPRHPIVWWIRQITQQAYKQADAVISLLPNSKAQMVSQGMPPDKFAYIPNGIHAEIFALTSSTPCPHHIEELMDKAKAAGKMTVIYAGTMGPPNALEYVLQLGEIQADDRPYHFFLLGDGVSRMKLEQEAKEKKLDFITFLPHVRREEAWAAIRKADVAYNGRKIAPLHQYGISFIKIFEYFMLQKPIVWAVDAGNNPVEETETGFSAIPADPFSLDNALRKMAAMSPEARAEMGQRGQKYVLEHHNWEELGQRYARICEQVYRGESLKAAL